MTDFEARVISAKREIRARSIDGIERRTVPFVWVQTRAQEAGDGVGFEVIGHAAVFNDLSEDLGVFDPWYERIAPGAFRDVLKRKPDVRALFNHDPNLVLARTKNGTLHLAEDSDGLQYRAEVPAGLSYGEDLRILLDRGDVDQSSFAFRVGESRWDEEENPDDVDGDPVLIRTITKFSDLFDVSPVTYPAYPTTDSGLATIGAGTGFLPVTLDTTSTTSLTTPSPTSERDSERAAATAEPMAEPGSADGAMRGLSREYVARDLAARERLLSV